MNLFSAINWQELPGNPTVINLDIIRGTEEQINNVPLRDKQFLFDTTNRIFYVDSATERIPYGNYKEIDTTGFIRSSQITRIEFVDSGYVPQQDDFILYLEIPGYPTITVDIHNLSIPNTGSTYTVNVSSNTFWTVFGGVYNTSSGNYELYWSSKKSTILIKPSKTPIQKGSSYYIEGDCRMDIVIDKNDTTNSYSNVISFITEDYGVKANVDLTQEAGEEPEPEYGGGVASSLQILSKDESECMKILNDKISMNLNEKDGYITITVYMPEPLAAAQLAFKVQMLLQQYVTDFKIEKVKANLDFVEGRYQEAKHQYEVKQEELALFEDANRNPSTSVARAAQARLTNEYTLLFGVYNELAKQREQAYIKVKETTPVFTVVEPVTIPAERSKPKRGLICIAFTFLGGFIGIGLVLILPFLAQVSGCKRLKGWLPEEKE